MRIYTWVTDGFSEENILGVYDVLAKKVIPADPNNADWKEYLQLRAEKRALCVNDATGVESTDERVVARGEFVVREIPAPVVEVEPEVVPQE